MLNIIKVEICSEKIATLIRVYIRYIRAYTIYLGLSFLRVQNAYKTRSMQHFAVLSTRHEMPRGENYECYNQIMSFAIA